MDQIQSFAERYLVNLHIPSINIPDVVEILIISFLVYNIMVWIKNTRAWSLLRGVIVILAFIVLAYLFNMTTILWIVKNVFSIAVIAIIVVLQPELRKALEELGRKNLFSSFIKLDSHGAYGLFSDRTIKEITKACVEMGRVRTGALIVVRQKDDLSEYKQTGIDVDGIVTSQLLINIFEKNTPLHDGAVIIEGDRVASATCYLPLSDNMRLSKELGTRHRAAVGMSDVNDSMTVIVSEETGLISVAYNGVLARGLNAEELESQLTTIQNKPVEEEKKRKLWKGKVSKNEKVDN
ncbi:diadenylate cyclase CdaA [Lacrimispora saccharolytica]|uniref:diadenylate cyclase CdaA n=1 Tax=Lacrimispora saccharolytica TaxID=84030 RepID=UPI001B5FE0FE|nr:diadenylate cyclase CdaA [Lacrimispora saccharolytica]MBP9001003.1 diadenylate cyclase CdaA [Lachnospiraceae bacterium]MBS7329330.1 diadenylate cyclase CdaA [Lachnospiraceae bacterium]MCF2657256.1 TIGR00159 family protein [Lacrimispora saccharolytica]MCI7557313.1 diadenylate cyclase CdaA [Lachnospiraceae bacterium]MDD7547843.1 diadenylate cyclase CdaA [Lachnospiraceae bacterium]